MAAVPTSLLMRFDSKVMRYMVEGCVGVTLNADANDRTFVRKEATKCDEMKSSNQVKY